jgi:hypothetical protein
MTANNMTLTEHM